MSQPYTGEILPPARRVPEPSPSSVLDLAPPSMAADPFGARPGISLRLSDLLITLRLRWKSLLVAFCVPVALGVGVATMMPVRFTAESVLMVLVNRESTAAQDISGIGPSVVSVEMLRVVRSEIEILQSDEVIQRTLQKVGVHALFPKLSPPVPGPDAEMAAAVDAFRTIVKAEADPSSNILRLRVVLEDRAMAIRTLSALIESYVERRSEMYTDENSRLLTAELARYGERLRATEAEIAQLRNRYSVLDIGQEMILSAARLDGIIQREDRLREQQVMATAQLQAARERLTAQPARVFASQDATNLSPNDDSRNQLSRLILERERMARQYTADYPPLQEMDSRISAARAAMRESARATYSTTREIRNPTVELLSQRVATLDLETGAMQQQLDELGRQRAENEARNAELVQADGRLRELRRQREGMEGVVSQLTTREAATRIEEDARRQRSPNVTVVQPASAPLNGRSIKRLVAAGGLAGGIGFATALALLLTLTRRSFATPDEAERGLSLPVLGTFGSLAPAAQDLKPMPEVADMVALLMDARIGRCRPCLMQLVSAGEDDDRDSLARAIVLEYARRSNNDTLLIDLQTDGRAHLAALGSRPVEAERIPGNVLVFSTVVPNLWISYDATKSYLTDPLATQEQTLNLLNQLRQAFDVVVVIGRQNDESYPMRRLTAMMDVNLIVVRGERTVGSRARAARDWVLGSGGTLLGFIYTGYRRVLPKFLVRIL